MSNIQAVAKAAGVSTATVSRVLAGKETVAADLVRRVNAAAAAAGYRPNGIAQSLRTRTTSTIALVIPDVSNAFFMRVARGVEDEASRSGFSVFLCNTDEDPAKERNYLEVAEQARVAGVVLSPNGRGSDISRMLQDRVPVVLIDRHLREPVDSVMVMSLKGARDATSHLLDQGWKRPACITGPRDASTAVARLRGFRAALDGVTSGDAPFEYADYREDGGRIGVARLFDVEDPPDSLFVANASMALGALGELRRRGLTVGRDVGFASFDDAPWAPYIDPPVTVVRQPAYEVGVRATELLLERIKGKAPEAPRHITMSPQLIVRRSSLRTSGS